MVRGKTERVEVLVGRYDGVEGIVGLESRSREHRLENLPCDADGVVFLQMELAARQGQHVGGNVEPGVGRELLPVNLDGGRRCCRSRRWLRRCSRRCFYNDTGLEESFAGASHGHILT